MDEQYGIPAVEHDVSTGTAVDTLPRSSPPPPPPPQPAQSPRTRLGWRQYVAVAAVAATGAAAVVVPTTFFDDDPPAPAAGSQPVAETAVDASDPTGATVADIAARVSPSVARVDAAGPAGSGSGSAVVYRADGYLVTNNHVVARAAQVTVTLPDGQRHEAEVVGADPTSDLAVLRIDATDLPAPTFAENDPRIGDTAIAIGSPFGLDGSVTSGIVSALNRTVEAQGTALADLVQTDAAINPGNSGGALVNGAGQLIGINTMIASAGGGSDGIGFAIPVSTVQRVADELIERGSVRHAYLGVSGATVSPDVAERYGLAAAAGAAIAVVEPGSPAQAAGLQRGDIVVAVDDREITSFPQFAGIVASLEPGDTATLSVVRGGEELELEVALGTRPQ